MSVGRSLASVSVSVSFNPAGRGKYSAATALRGNDRVIAPSGARQRTSTKKEPTLALPAYSDSHGAQEHLLVCVASLVQNRPSGSRQPTKLTSRRGPGYVWLNYEDSGAETDGQRLAYLHDRQGRIMRWHGEQARRGVRSPDPHRSVVAAAGQQLTPRHRHRAHSRGPNPGEPYWIKRRG
jgi:hypothetical protein